MAGARICASLRAACAGSGIPTWTGVASPLSPPSAARQALASSSRCPYKGREKLKGALSEGFLPPFRPWRWLQPGKTRLLLCCSQEGPWIL